MGYTDMEGSMSEMTGRFRAWVEGRMRSGLYTVWFAETAPGVVAGGAALWIRDRHPGLLGT
jgi:uncharacterized protein YfaQ (DUF2300 family)